MGEAVIVTGFGSIGKRHVKNLLDMGITPFVLTKYPDRQVKAIFVSKPEDISEDVKYAVICSPTYRHPDDISAMSVSGVRNFLVEKPIAPNMEQAEKILNLAHREKLNVHTAYNMRHLPCFNIIKYFIQQNLPSVRIVEICAGQYLGDWRPYRDYRTSYSAHRKEGGGVDLDLSHEIDYMLWLFGTPAEQNILKAKISEMEIDSPDVFVGTYRYPSFFVTIKLDCIRRKKERYMRIICENGHSLYCDFVNNTIRQCLSSNGREEVTGDENLFDMNKTYVDEIKEFLGKPPVEKRLLATLGESIKVLRAIN